VGVGIAGFDIENRDAGGFRQLHADQGSLCPGVRTLLRITGVRD